MEQQTRLDKLIAKAMEDRKVKKPEAPPKPKKLTRAEKAKLDRQKAIKQETVMAEQRKKRREEPKLATKQVDRNEMITVRVDAKTVIEIKRGEDPKKAIEKYKQLMAKKLEQQQAKK
jgi:hypothetical protein